MHCSTRTREKRKQRELSVMFSVRSLEKEGEEISTAWYPGWSEKQSVASI